MQNIVAKSQELYQLLVGKIAEVDKLKTELIIASRAVKDKEEQLLAKADDLNTRETAVKVIENVKALSETTVIIQRKVAADKEQLIIERTAFENYQAQVKTESHSLLGKLTSDIEANRVKAEQFEAEDKRLKEKEKKMREDIIKELAANIFSKK